MTDRERVHAVDLTHPDEDSPRDAASTAIPSTITRENDHGNFRRNVPRGFRRVFAFGRRATRRVRFRSARSAAIQRRGNDSVPASFGPTRFHPRCAAPRCDGGLT